MKYRNTRTVRLSDGKFSVTLPINPEEVGVRFGVVKEVKNLIGGEYLVPGRRKLRTISIKTWIPNDSSVFAPRGWDIRGLLAKLIQWHWHNVPVRVNITGLTASRYYLTDLYTSVKEGDAAVHVELEFTELREI